MSAVRRSVLGRDVTTGVWHVTIMTYLDEMDTLCGQFLLRAEHFVDRASPVGPVCRRCIHEFGRQTG